MKKFATMFVALALVLALASVALADAWLMYTNHSDVKVYEKPDTHSHTLDKIKKGGTKLLIEQKQGSWYAILVQDKSGDGQSLGWIQGKYLSDTMPSKYCSHKWSSWVVQREATCTQSGYRYRTCSVCGKKEEKEEKKLGHFYSKWIILKEATCAKTGQRERACEVCGYVQTETIDKVEHNYGKWKVVEEPTCTETGERYRICNECGYRQTQVMDMVDHEFGPWTIIRPATCTEVGQRVHTCQVCGTEVSQAIDKLPHDYEWKIIQAATDYSAGVRAKVCRICGMQTASETYDPEGTLRRGDRGEDVREVQNLLVEQGYLNAGGADGVYGGGTERAILKFQQAQGFYPDGIAWPQTLKRLRHEFGPWTTIKEMTRTAPGERVRTCLECGFEQRETIESGAVYERGSRGEAIRTLQQILSKLGYNVGGFDGIYGRRLDTAYASLAATRGLTAEDGKLRPGDVDAIIDAWLETVPASEWRGQGAVGDPVDLALTVTPAGNADDSGVVTYSWSLTNLGAQKCRAVALLLVFGDKPDFKADSLVMAVDGTELKANANNSITGSFSVSHGWGEGSLNFAALAATDSDNAKWLSNTVVFKAENADDPKAVKPMASDVNVRALADGTYPVAFNRGDIFTGASATFMNAVHIFSMDVYNADELEALRAGDSIVVSGETYEVKTVVRWGDTITVNGGSDNSDGSDFVRTDDGKGYRVRMFDDAATYTEQGVNALIIDPSAVYTDNSDPDAPVTAEYDNIIDTMKASANAYFDQYNTTLTIENGRVMAIERHYIP